MEIHRPSPLAPGASIRVIAPANYVTAGDVDPGSAILTAAGFNVSPCPHLFDRAGQFAGSDEVRARSFMDAFADPDVDAVIAARGGYGSLRLAPLIDWDMIRAHRKPFVGYSDLTAMLAHLTHRCGMVSFHGPVLRDVKDAGSVTAQSLVRALKGEAQDWTVFMETATGIQDGTASGPLVGGNLTMLATLMGGTAGFSANGAILLLEDISEYIYRLDRALVQLRAGGALDGVRGVVVSDLVDVEDGTVPFGMTAMEMIASHFPDVPIAAHVPAGHGPEKFTLALGAPATLTVENGKAAFHQAP